MCIACLSQYCTAILGGAAVGLTLRALIDREHAPQYLFFALLSAGLLVTSVSLPVASSTKSPAPETPK